MVLIFACAPEMVHVSYFIAIILICIHLSAIEHVHFIVQGMNILHKCNTKSGENATRYK